MRKFLLPLDLQFFSDENPTNEIDFDQLPELYTSDDAPAPEPAAAPSEPTEPEESPTDGSTELIDDDPTEPEAQTFDLGDLGTATLDDIQAWKNGHMMQSDYTNKTQALAQEKREFEENLRDQIQREISEQYAPYQEFEQLIQQNPNLQQQITALLQQQNASNPIPDPQIQGLKNQYEGQLNQLQQQIADIQRQEQMREAQAEWSSLKSRYPDAEKMGQEIVQLADSKGYDLETAYRLLTYDTVQARVKEDMVKNQMRKKENHTPPAGSGNARTEPSFNPAKASEAERRAYILQNFKLTE